MSVQGDPVPADQLLEPTPDIDTSIPPASNQSLDFLAHAHNAGKDFLAFPDAPQIKMNFDR